MSYRELWVLVNRLPQESWTQTALRDSRDYEDLVAPIQADAEVKFGPWALSNYQMADLIDAIRENTWMTQAVVAGDQAPEHPKPTPRPGAKPAKVRALTPEGMAYLRALRSPKEE